MDSTQEGWVAGSSAAEISRSRIPVYRESVEHTMVAWTSAKGGLRCILRRPRAGVEYALRRGAAGLQHVLSRAQRGREGKSLAVDLFPNHLVRDPLRLVCWP